MKARHKKGRGKSCNCSNIQAISLCMKFVSNAFHLVMRNSFRLKGSKIRRKVMSEPYNVSPYWMVCGIGQMIILRSASLEEGTTHIHFDVRPPR